MGMDRRQIMGYYFPTFQVISVIRPFGLPAETADRRIWRMKPIVRRFVFCKLSAIIYFKSFFVKIILAYSIIVPI